MCSCVVSAGTLKDKERITEAEREREHKVQTRKLSDLEGHGGRQKFRVE